MAYMVNCQRCGAIINLSDSGFCKKCGMNHWATPDGHKRFLEFVTPKMPFEKNEGVIRNLFKKYKRYSAKIKILKW